MRQDRELVFKLRKEGKSYREIQKQTGISRATLSAWFKNISWSKHVSENNNLRNLGASKENMTRMNLVRKLKLQYQYALVEAEALKEYEVYKREPLFWAGLMVYAGEGDKRNKNQIRITNTEFHLHKIFIQFALKYLDIKRQNMRCALILYADHNESLCREMWSNLLEIPREQFYKTQIINGKEQKRKLQYGIGMSIISSTVLKKKLIKWLSLAQDEKFENAVIV